MKDPKSLRDAGLVTAVSFAWLLILSSWLGVGSRGSALQRDNVFFGSDTRSWLGRVVSPEGRTLPNLEIGPHPIAMQTWRPPARAVARAVNFAGVKTNREELAGRMLVALVAAVGIGCLALTATIFQVEGARFWMLFGLYLLSTANMIVALPEYFGVSNGILSMFFAAYVLLPAGAWRFLVLPGLGLIIAGTTITNAVLPLLAAVQSWIPGRVVRAIGFSALILSGPAALVFLGWISTASLLPDSSAPFVKDVAQYARMFTKGNVTDHPGNVLERAVISMIYPIVAPPRWLRLSPRQTALHFGSYRFHDYTIMGIVAVVGWIALLVASIAGAAVSNRWPYLHVLAAWIAFNLVLHTVWGDEQFLYSPHWSWALFGLVLLGAGRLPLQFVAATCLAAAPGQIQMLLAVKQVAAIIR